MEIEGEVQRVLVTENVPRVKIQGPVSLNICFSTLLDSGRKHLTQAKMNT